MIAVDTNVLARFYISDPSDREAAAQARRARHLVLDSAALFVPVTVVLELEWVMRGFYRLAPEAFCSALNHLLGMAHVTVQHWEAVRDAAALHARGLDFADALHWSLSAGCERLVSFDDRKFVRRARRLAALAEADRPAVVLPAR